MHDQFVPTAYQPVDCADVPFIASSAQYVQKQLEDMKCADMGENKMSLRNSISGIKKGNLFYFVVDTCAKLAKYTGNTNCLTDEEVLPNLNKFSVFAKISEEYFSAPSYIENDFET